FHVTGVQTCALPISRSLRVTALSFGYKYGLPPDADLVLDARFLPNPHWVPRLRDLTGQASEVSAYVLGQHGARTFVETVARLVKIGRASCGERGERL